jgi:protocatechuate 3,4-dioxygenase beta subunit
MSTVDKVTRRNALGLMCGAALTGLVAACGGSSTTSSVRRTKPASTTSTTTACSSASNATTTSCTLIPEETAGPYPLDLHNNPAIVRRDITEGRTGVSLTLVLTLLNVNDNCSPITNARVDVWHCDKDGVYSG